jgi:DNA polymerase-3 subunit delta
MHATAFLSDAKSPRTAPVVVLHGSESHLKQEALRMIVAETLGADEDSGLDLSRYQGKDAEFKAVRDELMTVSMFATGRVVVVEDADDFISRHRPAIEEYLEKPSRSSVLALDVKSWPKNTRLAKKLPEHGLEIECSELTGARLQQWLIEEAKGRFDRKLGRDAAALMPELAGTSMSLLSRELEKLASYVGDREQITTEDVRLIVGGWRAETTWEMIDAIRDGRPGPALHALERLLIAGEAAPKILGGLNYVFRKLAAATELSRLGTPLRAALKQAGVFPRDIDAAERYLRRVGRARAEQIIPLLAAADSNLKGGSRVPEHLQMEQLLLQLCGTMPL